MTSSSWYVYIIRTEKRTLYTGITTDVERRFAEHQAVFDGKRPAKGAKYFRRTKPVEVVYVEICENRSEASKREASIKGMTRAQKLALVEATPYSGL